MKRKTVIRVMCLLLVLVLCLSLLPLQMLRVWAEEEEEEHVHDWQQLSLNEEGDALLVTCSMKDCGEQERIAWLAVEGLDDTSCRVYDGTEAFDVGIDEDLAEEVGIELTVQPILKEKMGDSKYESAEDVANVGKYRIESEIQVAGTKEPFTLQKEYEVVPRALTISGITAEEKICDGTTSVDLKKDEDGTLIFQVSGIADGDKDLSAEELGLTFSAKLPKADANRNDSGEIVPYELFLTYSLSGSKKDNYKLSDATQQTVEVMVWPKVEHNWKFTVNTAGDALLAECADADCPNGWNSPVTVAYLTVDGLSAEGTRTYDGNEAVNTGFDKDQLSRVGTEIVFLDHNGQKVWKEVKNGSAYQETDSVASAGQYRVSAKLRVPGAAEPLVLSKEYEVTPRPAKIDGIVAETKYYNGKTDVSLVKTESGKVKYNISGLLSDLSDEELAVSITADDLPAADVKTDDEGNPVPYQVKLKIALSGSKAANYKLSDDSQVTVEVLVLPKVEHSWQFAVNEDGDTLLVSCTDADCPLKWGAPKTVAQLKVADLSKTEKDIFTRIYDGTEAVSAELVEDVLKELDMEVTFVEESEETIRKEEKQGAAYVKTDDVSNVGQYRVSVKVQAATAAEPFALSKAYEVTPRDLKITGIVAENKYYDGTTAISFEKKEGSTGVKCSVVGLAEADKKASKKKLSISFTGKLLKADVQLNDDGEEIPYDVELTYSINGEKKDNYNLTADTQQTVQCTVMRTSIQDAKVTLDEAFFANGEEQIRTVKKVVVTVGSRKVALTEGTDFEVTGNKCKEAGEYTMTLTGKGNFKDSVSVPFRVLPDIEETDEKEIRYGAGAAKLVVSDPDNIGIMLETTLRELMLKLPGDQLENILLGDRVVWTLEATKPTEEQQKVLAKTVSTSLKPGQYVQLTMTAKSAQDFTYREGFNLQVKMGISSKLQNTSSGKRRDFSVLMPVTTTSAKVLQSALTQDERAICFTINTKEFNGSWYILAYKDVAVVTTGDTSPVVIVASVLVLAIGGLGILLYFENKSRKRGSRGGKFTR